MILFLALTAVLADQVAADIGNDIILESEVAAAVSFMGSDPAVQTLFKNPKELWDYALNDLIARKLLLAQAEIDSIKVSDDEVEERMNTAIDNLKTQFPSEADFYQELAKAGIQLEDLKKNYRDNIRTQQILAQLVAKKIVPNIMVSPTAIRKFYEDHKDSMAVLPGKVKLAHIILPIKQSEAEQKKGFERALEVYKLLLSGGDFGVIAQEFSDDPNSKQFGGMLGKIKKGESFNEFEGKVFDLKPGTVSQPFPTRLGFHIVEVLNKGPDWVLARQILIRVEVSKADTANAEKLARRITDLANHGADFDSLAKIYTYAPDVDLGEVITNRLMPPLDSAVKDLEAKQASAPILTPWGYQILYVREKVPEKKLSFEELRDYIYRYLFEQEQEKIYKLYIDELKEKTFVKVFPPRTS
jgi:peptidyl-prolyl cis-trans isomerase SurA